MNDEQTWQAALDELKLQMTTATYDTWLHGTTGHRKGNTITVTVKNAFAQDWLEHRLQATIKRTLARLTGQTVELRFVVAQQEEPSSTGLGVGSPTADPRPGMIQEKDRDLPPDCRMSVELINFDPRERGFVLVSNYALIYWQPYLNLLEREAGSRSTGLAFRLWETLRAFGAHWDPRTNDWPTVIFLAHITAHSNRHRLLGRGPRGSEEKGTYRKEVTGAITTLEQEQILYITSRHAGRFTEYIFRVLDRLPLLTPTQAKRLPAVLQEAHQRELARSQLDYQEWQQYTLPLLLED